MTYNQHWKARVREGVAQYSFSRRPTQAEATIQLSGVDGGDIGTTTGFGYPTSVADGGDFNTMAAVSDPYPGRVDGGLIGG